MELNKSDLNTKGKDETPAFNQGIDYISRLHILCKSCNESSILSNHVVWYNCVQSLYRELSSKMNEEETTNYKKLIKRAKRQHPRNRDCSYSDIMISNAEVYLRKIMDKKGLLMPTKDSPGQAILD